MLTILCFVWGTVGVLAGLVGYLAYLLYHDSQKSVRMFDTEYEEQRIQWQAEEMERIDRGGIDG